MFVYKSSFEDGAMHGYVSILMMREPELSFLLESVLMSNAQLNNECLLAIGQKYISENKNGNIYTTKILRIMNSFRS